MLAVFIVNGVYMIMRYLYLAPGLSQLLKRPAERFHRAFWPQPWLEVGNVILGFCASIVAGASFLSGLLFHVPAYLSQPWLTLVYAGHCGLSGLLIGSLDSNFSFHGVSIDDPKKIAWERTWGRRLMFAGWLTTALVGLAQFVSS
jgi:hypothetical protein